MIINIPDDWTPTTGSINALPRPLREYIMRLSTDENRAGLIAKVQILEEQVKALNRMLEEAPEVEMPSRNHPRDLHKGLTIGVLAAEKMGIAGKRVRLVVVDE